MRHRTSSGLVWLLLGTLAAVATGCDGTGPEPCMPALQVTPAEPRLAVGDSLELAASVEGCGAAGAPALAWSTSDPSIVVVDAQTGRSVGVRAGQASVLVQAAGATAPGDTVGVMVFAPLFDRIIFSRRPSRGHDCAIETCPFQIWTLRLAGGELALVVDSVSYPEHIRVSPDGRKIVFEDQWRIYITDAGGGARRELATGTDHATEPSWSPDGRWIAFTGIMGDTDTADVQVYLIHPDGSGRRKLTEESSAARNPAWSPDGELVYIRGYQDGLGPMRLQAVAIDQQGGNPRVLTESLAAFTGWSPAWSPDGQSLLFLDVLNEDWAITRLTPATMQFDTLGLAHGNRPGDWKPDGRQIVFGTGDLWLMAPDGSQARTVLADGAVNFEAAWTPAAPSAP